MTPDAQLAHGSTAEHVMVQRAPWRERASWALYDFANTIFSMNVATLYFSVWLIKDLGASSTLYAIGSDISSILWCFRSHSLVRCPTRAGGASRG